MFDEQIDLGEGMHNFGKELWPICRSITGDGVRQTLGKIKNILPNLKIYEVPTGTKCFDWIVPNEWNIKEAFIVGPDDRCIVDLKNNNLHVVGYSEPVDLVLTLEELQKHLHSLPDMPDAIPYVTSYYKRTWGFCITDRQRKSLCDGMYRVKIDATLQEGHLTYGEILIPGKSESEIFLSTYVCHPSMANNELSGPLVTTWLAKWLVQNDNYYSYRIIFIPETIGSIVYLSRNLSTMKNKTIAGFVLSCVGDERAWSYLPSRYGNTLSDRVAKHVLSSCVPNFKEYTFLDRGSDERQYCSPCVDLPVCSVMRSKYVTYPEYHTSQDDLDFVTPTGLAGSLDMYKKMIQVLEKNGNPKTTVVCEPMMSRRGLRPTMSKVGAASETLRTMNVLAYADGCNDLIAISEFVEESVFDVIEIIDQLLDAGLVKLIR